LFGALIETVKFDRMAFPIFLRICQRSLRVLFTNGLRDNVLYLAFKEKRHCNTDTSELCSNYAIEHCQSWQFKTLETIDLGTL
jgi:hypothetical protein